MKASPAGSPVIPQEGEVEVSMSRVLPRPVESRAVPRRASRTVCLAAGSGSEKPERERPSATQPVAAARAQAQHVPPRRVLVVDDDAGLRLICRFNLEAVGMEVREAPDGETALAMATAEPPDVILLDVMMPGLDGWAVAAELARREETRNVPVVFVTARVTDADRVQGVELACAAYVTKPFDPS